MITLRDIRKTYRMGDVDVHALRGASLEIKAGEFVAIMGPSGSGKSTLMHIIGLLDLPDGGVYSLNGQSVDGLDEDAIAILRSQSIGFVFQQFNLLPRTTALANVGLPLLYHPRKGVSDWPAELLKKVGLGDRQFHKPNEMSGGQQQRVAIARALVNRPLLILADEPTGNLDTASEREIMALFTELNAQGMTIIVVTHEAEVADFAKRVIHMRDGKIERDETRHPRGGGDPGPSAKNPIPSSEEIHTAINRSWFKLAAAHISQATKALVASKVRTTLSTLGVLIGVAAVIAVLALGAGAKKSIQDQLASMGSNLLVLRPGERRSGAVALEAGAVTRFTLEDAQAITEIDGVRRTSPTVSGRGQLVYGGQNANTSVQGVGADYADMRAAQPQAGRFITEEDIRSRARVAVIGMTPVRALFGDAYPVGSTIKINRISFQVIGVLPEKGSTGFRDQDDVVIIPISTAMRRLMGKNFVDGVDIEVVDASQMADVQDQVTKLILGRHRLGPDAEDSIQIRNMADIQAAVSQTSKTMTLLLGCIAAISLVIGGIGIMNIMLVSVTERTREIGLRKAVGAKRPDIMLQFLVESLMVSLLGGLCGIALGWGSSMILAKLSGWSVIISPLSIGLAFGFSATVGIVFGLWPAYKASRLKPIEALRWE